MTRPVTALIAAAFVLCAAANLHAQSTNPNCFSIAAGVGAGWGRVSCDVCQTSRDLGPTAFVRVGTSVRNGVHVAGEATIWTHEVEDERENMGALMATLYLHPQRGALYVKSGLGLVAYRAGEQIALNSVGLQLGAGYDLRLGGLAITNYLNLIGSSFGSLKNGDATIAEDVSTTLLQFGVGLTLR